MPNLFTGVREDRCHHSAESRTDFPKYGLARTTQRAIRQLGVETVFEDIQVERAQLHVAVVEHSLGCLVERILIVGRGDIRDQ